MLRHLRMFLHYPETDMMNHELRIALLGTINRDTIHHRRWRDNRKLRRFACLYSILALAEIASSHVAIYPICNVGADMEAVTTLVREKLAPYPHVKLDGTPIRIGQDPHCFLDYDAKGPQTRNHCTMTSRKSLFHKLNHF